MFCECSLYLNNAKLDMVKIFKITFNITLLMFKNTKKQKKKKKAKWKIETDINKTK